LAVNAVKQHAATIKFCSILLFMNYFIELQI